MRDSNLILRDGSTNLTANETGFFSGGTWAANPSVDGMSAGSYSGGTLTANGWLDIGKGGILNGLELEIVVPSQSGTTPTLDLQLQFSDDASTIADYVDLTGGATLTSTSSYPAVLQKRVRSRHRYLRYNAIVTGTTPSFGAVTIQAASGLGFREANVPNT